MTRAPRLMRVTTHDISLDSLLRGQLGFMAANGFDVVGVAADTGRLDSVRSREGVRCIDVPMNRQISPLADLRSLWRMVRTIRRERPDIVHANTPKGSLLSMLAAWICRVPVRIYTVTGLRFETAGGIFRFILKSMERITCACATEVIPEGDGVARTLVGEGITSRPLRKIHNGNINGIDLSHFDPEVVAPIRRFDSGTVTFIFIGRVVRDKGVTELVRAFDRLSRDYRGKVRLLMVGPYEPDLDPVDDSIRMIIKENTSIAHVGHQADVRPWIASADVLVLPSYREGFPNSVLEGGAMGIPVIVTDVNGADEIITSGVNGLIVPRRDADALYDAMERLVSDPGLRRKMASAARGVIMDKFNRKDIHKATLERYRELLKKQ